MAVVPFRISGPAASQQLEQQLLQVGPHSLLLRQRPHESGNTEHLKQTMQQQHEQQDQEQQQQQQQLEQQPRAAAAPRPDLSRVGLVLWQSGFVLSDFLLQRLPQLLPGGSTGGCCWPGTRVLELGCGAGTVGMFLARAGAWVVLTDQPHILPLTRDNLAHNFPAAAAVHSRQQHSSSSSSSDAAAAAATQVSQARAAAMPAAPSAAAAFAAAFGSEPQPAAAAGMQGAATGAAAAGWQVFGAGPLVAEFTWGEPAQQLHARVAEAAVQRAGGAAAAAALGAAPNPQQQQQQQQQPAPAAAQFDVIVGADLLYDPSCYAALLGSLEELAAPHTQVYLCYRRRGLGEEGFEAAAQQHGWVLAAAPPSALHPEFQDGDYLLLQLQRLG